MQPETPADEEIQHIGNLDAPFAGQHFADGGVVGLGRGCTLAGIGQSADQLALEPFDSTELRCSTHRGDCLVDSRHSPLLRRRAEDHPGQETEKR